MKTCTGLGKHNTARGIRTSYCRFWIGKPVYHRHLMFRACSRVRYVYVLAEKLGCRQMQCLVFSISCWHDLVFMSREIENVWKQRLLYIVAQSQSRRQCCMCIVLDLHRSAQNVFQEAVQLVNDVLLHARSCKWLYVLVVHDKTLLSGLQPQRTCRQTENACRVLTGSL